MKIVCLLKVVPDTETKFQINDTGTDIVEDSGIEFIIAPYDEYAVEEAIRIKEKLGGEVISLTIGSGVENKSIRKAMAMGVDSGVLIENAELKNSDPLSIARALAEELKLINPDIILCGKQASDSSDSFVGPAIAALLNMPVVTEVSDLEVSETGVVATRDASGRKEKFEVSYPVLITADKGLNEPRYPKLPDIMKAKKKPLDTKTEPVSEIRNNVKQVAAAYPPIKGSGKKITGTPDEMVTELVTGLSTKDKVF